MQRPLMMIVFQYILQNYSVSKLKVISCHSTLYLMMSVSCIMWQCDDTKPVLHITEIEPAPGCQGSSLSIHGWGFSSKINDNIVKLDNRVLEVMSASSNELTVLLPRDAITGQITVQVGSQVAAGPTHTINNIKYFIRFKANGQPRIFELCEPRYGNVTATCGYGYVSDVNGNLAVISACNTDKMTLAFMDSWAGSTMVFGNSQPFARLEYYDSEEEKFMSSLYTYKQQDSELRITEVLRGIGEPHLIEYDVKGTFRCNVAATNSADVSITEGEFSVRFAISSD